MSYVDVLILIVAMVAVRWYVGEVIARLRRLSFNELQVLGVILASPKGIVSVAEVEKKSQVKKKSLGGVLSALSRNNFRGESLIEPLGRARDARGLRWQVNSHAVDKKEAKKEVVRLLSTY